MRFKLDMTTANVQTESTHNAENQYERFRKLAEENREAFKPVYGLGGGN